ncbi:uncharacterized protein LOC144170448 isoform X1 [Haemaphysalis longicornis]
MTSYLLYLFANVFCFSMAFEIGDAGIKIPGLERTMASGTCSDVNDVMKVCQRELGPLFEVSARRGRSRRMKARMEVDKNTQFENCLLHRQELTVREYTAWCEHKQSVARKISVCYRYILDSVEHTIPEDSLTNAVQKFEDCMRHERPTMGDSMSDESEYTPGPESSGDDNFLTTGSGDDTVSWAEDDKNRDDHTHEPESDDREFTKSFYDVEEEGWDSYSDTGLLDEYVSSSEEQRDDFFREKTTETSAPETSTPDDDDTFAGPWSYAGLDNSYYYPRREKGLGNDTSVQNHTAVAKEQPKPPTKPAGVKEASTKKAAQVTTSKPPKK